MVSEILKKGSLLIAEPSIVGDVLFNRSVILLADYSDEGSVGFIINKPLKYNLSDFIRDVDAKFEIYNGGPVEQDNLYFIHNIPELVPKSIEISNGIYWGGDFEFVKKLIKEGKLTSDNIRFFLGYTGWSKDQLELETRKNSWIVAKNNYNNKIISKSSAFFWKEQIMELGDEYIIWSNTPENPYLN